MGKRKLYCAIVFTLVMTAAVTACSKKNDEATYQYENVEDSTSYSYDKSGSGIDMELNGEAVPVTATNGTAENAEAPAEGSGITSTTTFTTDSSQLPAQDKIIQRYFLDVETQDFDNLISTIDTEIKRLAGYVENSQISGRRYYYSKDNRTGNIIARIPSDKADEFVGTVNTNANVVNKQITTDNVTMQYIDTESRISALKIEQERLFAILEKAEELESIITLESRLSDIRYELQNYESQLRQYDNQVAYSTITLNIQEVDRITPVSEEKESTGERIQKGFGESIYHIGEGLKNFFVWFVINLPYLLIWGVIITVIVLVIRRINRKSNARKYQPPMYSDPANLNPMNGMPPVQEPQNPDQQNKEP